MSIYYLVWDLTSWCNANCLHCYANAGARDILEPTTDQVYQIIDQLEELGTILIGFSGGECLGRQDIFDILKYTSYKGISSSLSTNGILINPDVAKNLKECKIGRVQISIDGLKETHDEFRGVNGLFEQVLKALQILLDEGITTTASITPNKLNIDQIPKLIEMASELGVTSCNFAFFTPVGRGSKDLNLLPYEWKKLLQFLIKTKKEYKGGINIGIHDPRLAIMDEEFTTMPEFIGCSAGLLHAYLTVRGDLFPCAFLHVPMGNIREKPIREILETSQLRKDLENRENLKGRCGECENKSICGGCRAMAHAYYKDIFTEDPRCWFR